MLAIFAALIFALAAFGVHIGDVNLTDIGLALFALYFVVALGPWAHPRQ